MTRHYASLLTNIFSSRRVNDFASDIEDKSLDQAGFMDLCARNEDILNPVKRWRDALVDRCGGAEFWREQDEHQSSIRETTLAHAHSNRQILKRLLVSNFILLSSFCYSIIKARTFYVIRFCFSMLAFVFIILQTSDISTADNVSVTIKYFEYGIDIYFISEGIMKIIAITAGLRIHESLGQERHSVFDIVRSSGVLSSLASILSLSFGTSFVGDWAKLCRLVFLTSNSLRRMQNIDVLMVSLSVCCDVLVVYNYNIGVVCGLVLWLCFGF